MDIKLKLQIFLFSLFTITFGYGQFKAGDDIIISQAYDGDLYLAGGSLSINAPVYGDLTAAGGEITINDSIQQDLLIAGGEMSVYAPIGDDIRCAGGNVTINGPVGDDFFVFAGDITIGKDIPVKGNLVVFGGRVEMNGEVQGDIKLFAGEVKLNGPVAGNVDAKLENITFNDAIGGYVKVAAETIKFGDEALVAGDFNYWTEDGEIDLDPSKIGGKITFDEELMPDRDGIEWYWGGLFFFLLGLSMIVSALLVILILKWLFGNYLNHAAGVLKEEIGGSIGYGFLYLIGLPVVIGILFAIVIGIPVGFFLLSIYGFSLLFGQAVFSLILIYYFNQQRETPWNGSVIILLSWAVLILLRFVGFIPFIGWLISILVIAAAYGSIILLVIKRNRARKLGILEEAG